MTKNIPNTLGGYGWRLGQATFVLSVIFYLASISKQALVVLFGPGPASFMAPSLVALALLETGGRCGLFHYRTSELIEALRGEGGIETRATAAAAAALPGAVLAAILLFAMVQQAVGIGFALAAPSVAAMTIVLVTVMADRAKIWLSLLRSVFAVIGLVVLIGYLFIPHGAEASMVGSQAEPKNLQM